MTTDEAIENLARQVGRSVYTLRRWEDEGRIPPAHRIGTRRKRHWTPEEAAQIRALAGVSEQPDLDSLEQVLQQLAPAIAKAARDLTAQQASSGPSDIMTQAQSLLGGATVKSLTQDLIGR